MVPYFMTAVGKEALQAVWFCPLPQCFVFLPVGVEGGFDITEEKFEYDEDVKIVILPEHLDIPRDGLEGLPDMVRDRVRWGEGRCFLLVGRR